MVQCIRNWYVTHPLKVCKILSKNLKLLNPNENINKFSSMNFLENSVLCFILLKKSFLDQVCETYQFHNERFSQNHLPMFGSINHCNHVLLHLKQSLKMKILILFGPLVRICSKPIINTPQLCVSCVQR